MQHVGDPLAAPEARVGTGFCHRQIAVGGRSGYPLLIKEVSDIPTAHPTQCQRKNPLHNGGHFLVDDNFVFLRGVHLVAIHWLSTDKLPLPLFIPLDALDLFGDVLGVHIVHDRPERCDVVGGGVHTGVDAVQQRDVTYPVLREVPLHVVAGHDVVTAQTGEIFGNDHIDLLCLNIGNHPLKIRTVKVGAAPAVVHIGIVDAQPVLLHKLPQQGLLVLDALRWSLALILLR